MATTVTGKLYKSANEFQAGDSIGFGVRVGVRYYDRKTKQNEFTNYGAALFAKPGPQADFYRSALVEGSVIEISCESLKIELFEGSNGPVLTNQMNNARLGFVHTADRQPGGSQSGNCAQQSPPQQSNNGAAPPADFDDDIPF